MSEDSTHARYRHNAHVKRPNGQAQPPLRAAKTVKKHPISCAQRSAAAGVGRPGNWNAPHLEMLGDVVGALGSAIPAPQ